MLQTMLFVGLSLSPIAAAAGSGGGAILKVSNVNATRGQMVSVPVRAETMDIIGAFGFNATPLGLEVEEVLYNGPIFSNGWNGWDTAPSPNVRVDAACIFTEDQIAPGDHQLVGLTIEVPANLQPGTVIPITLSEVSFFNYDFSVPTLEALDGSIRVFRTSDLNGDGIVTPADLGLMLADWGPVTKSPVADVNGDGVVNGADIGRLLDRWGTEG